MKKDTGTTELNLGTMYDINKNLVENYEKNLTTEELQDKKQIIIDYLEKTNMKYYMLLCNDRKDYTVFNNVKNNKQEMADILIDECLLNRGTVKSLNEKEKESAIEIWLSIEGESYCYYLFVYDFGVIEY